MTGVQTCALPICRHHGVGTTEHQQRLKVHNSIDKLKYSPNVLKHHPCDMIRYGGSGYVDMAAQHRDAKACTLLTFQDINPDIPPSRDVQEMKMASCADVGHG